MNHAKLNLMNLIPEASSLDYQTFLLVNLDENNERKIQEIGLQ